MYCIWMCKFVFCTVISWQICKAWPSIYNRIKGSERWCSVWQGNWIICWITTNVLDWKLRQVVTYIHWSLSNTEVNIKSGKYKKRNTDKKKKTLREQYEKVKKIGKNKRDKSKRKRNWNFRISNSLHFFIWLHLAV